MGKSFSTIGMLLAIAPLTTQRAWACRALSADEFGTRCAGAGGLSTGDFAINGPLDGELQIEHSQIFQSAQAGGPVNVTFIAHRNRIEHTTMDVSGNIILRSGEPSHGDVLVEGVRFRSPVKISKASRRPARSPSVLKSLEGQALTKTEFALSRECKFNPEAGRPW